MARLFVSLQRLSCSERNLFLWTFIVTCFISLLVTLFPRRLVFKRIGNVGVETAMDISEVNIVTAKQIATAVRRANRYSPWRVTCFARALSAKYLLKRSGVQSTLYLGVAKDGLAKITAHAWLRSGPVIVTGKEEMRRFTVVAFFS